MTDIKLPSPVNDNETSLAITEQSISARGGVLSVLTGLSEPTRKVLQMLGLVPDSRHPEVILEELSQKRKAVGILEGEQREAEADNDNVSDIAKVA